MVENGYSHGSSLLLPSIIWLPLSSDLPFSFHQLKLKLHKIISFLWIPPEHIKYSVNIWEYLDNKT